MTAPRTPVEPLALSPFRIERQNYSRWPWRLLDGEGRQVCWLASIDHPDIGRTMMSEPVAGDTKTECTAKAMLYLAMACRPTAIATPLAVQATDEPQDVECAEAVSVAGQPCADRWRDTAQATDEREAIFRAVAAAMPHTNPEVWRDWAEGHNVHMEPDDIIAIWQAARAHLAQAPAALRFAADADSPLISALAKFTAWAASFEDRGQPEWLYVHTDRSGHQTRWPLDKTLRQLADLLMQNDIDTLKLKHVEKVLGPATLAAILKERA